MRIDFYKIIFLSNSLTKVLFNNGWVFILPYLFFYFYGWHYNLSVNTLQSTFVDLHILNIILISYYLLSNLKNINIKELLFWLVLALLFILPGAYLEFPSDTWEHFRRIFAWQNNDFIIENSVRDKFTYFWGWTFMFQLEPIYRRLALNFYSAFWQLLLAYQFYLLALKLGFNKNWAKVQVVGTMLLFGTNLFSFYRYYAISSTPLAYIAYLRLIITLLDVRETGSKKGLLILPFLLLIMRYNHVQELLLSAIAGIALLIDFLLNKWQRRKIILGSFVFAITLFFPLGAWIVDNPQAIPIKSLQDLHRPSDLYLSNWGNFRIWDFELSYFETWGINGLISLLLAFLFLKKYQTISLLTLTPPLLLLFPPFSLLFAASHDVAGSHWVTYRALFAFPNSFMLVIGVKDLLLPFLSKIKLDKKKLKLNIGILFLTLFILLITLLPYFPFRGKFWFLTYALPSELTLQQTDIAAQWLLENRSINSKCQILSDGGTKFMLATHLGLKPLPPDRRIPYSPGNQLKTLESLESYLKANNVCFILVPIQEKLPQIPVSPVARLSKHWAETLVIHNFRSDPQFAELANRLRGKGWTQTFVPPFYWLYEFPRNVHRE